VLPTADALHAQLDADPGNHHLRLVLADALDEAAGAVACPTCDGRGYGRCDRCSGEGCSVYGVAANGPCGADDCRHCSGTGRVSDGRAEIAAGLRVLAELGRVPHRDAGVWRWWGIGHNVRLGSLHAPHDMPDVWRMALGEHHGYGTGARYPTRREAEEHAAIAWHKLTPIQQAAILVPAAKRP
jgi:hypothetical protein